MNIKKFVFKFINHDNKKCHVFEFDVHSTKLHEWNQKEDDIEGYVRWLSQHARWEKVLKKQIKKMVVEKIPVIGEIFKDYVLTCEKSERKSKNINTNKVPGNELHFVQVFHMEKCILKYVKGNNNGASKGIDKIAQLAQYKKYHEIMHLIVSGDDANVVLREISCAQDNKIIIQQDQNSSETKTTNVNTQSTIPTTQLTYTTKTTTNQSGGNDDDYNMYKKYKKKYLDLKNANY